MSIGPGDTFGLWEALDMGVISEGHARAPVRCVGCGATRVHRVSDLRYETRIGNGTYSCAACAAKRKRVVDYERVAAMHKSGASIKAIAAEFGVHRNTIMRILDRPAPARGGRAS